jgi:hypothetical protein
VRGASTQLGDRLRDSPVLTGLVVTGLLAIGAVGLAGRNQVRLSSRPPATGYLVTVAVVLVGLAVLFGCVLLLLALLASRRPLPDQLELRRPSLSRWMAQLVVLALVAGLLAWAQRFDVGYRRLFGSADDSSKEAALDDRATGPSWSWPLTAVLALLAVAAALAWVTARVGKGAETATEVGPASAEQPALTPPRSRTRVERTAASTHDSARQAVIACYQAMQEDLATVHAPGAVTDTPAELLARATAAGLIRSAAAATLTDLFRAARYSTRPLPGDAGELAARSLTQLEAELSGKDRSG